MATIETGRLTLQETLKLILGSSNVYFEPPENIRITYPCFVYSRAQVNATYASDSPYRRLSAYDVTYITRDPRDTDVIDAMLALKYCTHNRHYVTDNLHHDVFHIQI